MATRLGIEVIGRTGEIFTPMVIILFLILTVAIIPQMEIVRMLPILEDGIKPVLRGSISISAYTFLEPVVFLMFLPYVNQQKNNKSLITGLFPRWDYHLPDSHCFRISTRSGFNDQRYISQL